MKHMAYPSGLLVRPDGNIRYQYRIPKDLLKYYPKALMSENLGTKDKALAAQMIYARKAELEREYVRLRAQSNQALAHVGPSQNKMLHTSPKRCWPRQHKQMRSYAMRDKSTS
jgi:hypothetical protein